MEKTRTENKPHATVPPYCTVGVNAALTQAGKAKVTWHSTEEEETPERVSRRENLRNGGDQSTERSAGGGNGKGEPRPQAREGKIRNTRGSRTCRGERTPKKRAGSNANLAGPLVPRMRARGRPLLGTVLQPIEQSLGNAQYRCGERRSRSEQGKELVVTYAERTWQYRRHWTGGISHQRIHTRFAGMQVCDRALLAARVPTA